FELIQSMYKNYGFDMKPLIIEKEGKKESKENTYVLSKNINGISIKIIITMDNSDVKEALNDENIDIVGHRGHSFELQEETFCKNYKSRGNQLFFLGSCGSFREVPDIQKNMPNNYYLCDENMGVGEDNNQLLYYIMLAIANNKTTWQEVRDFINNSSPDFKLNEKGIVFPDQKGLLLRDYLSK
ncbi:MAG: hypothetical protein KKA19_02125, partial [Candidatus Margulisbacteria bacterium]|nr:hypothetical protein [Candidatus Margulisiibacteriota bacterium]